MLLADDTSRQCCYKMWRPKIWRRRLLVLSQVLRHCKIFREQIWSSCSRLRGFSLVIFLKVSGMPLICLWADFEKHCFSRIEKGIGGTSSILIPHSHCARVNLDTKTPILQQIWQKSVRMVRHWGWWDWGQSDRRPAPRGTIFGQECPNSFLCFVLNSLLNGVRSDGLCRGVFDPISSVS